MASFNPIKCGVTLRLNTGTDGEGNPVVKNVVLNKVRPAVTADQIDALGDALAPLLAHPVLEIRKTGVDSVLG
jgi:hypothetical protein